MSVIYIIFFDIHFSQIVFKLELSKYVYCTLKVYTGGDTQPKVFVQILLRYFLRHFL